jgi:glycoprotein-N-acetylgalactosamine 3-beta-galactosyltransferase
MNDFDYFLLGGDDMFYIIENLKYYLNSEEVRGEAARGKGIYIGRKFQPPGQKIFNSGGAGYILDKVSLKLLGDNLDAPSCHPKQVGFWEDVNIASCLKVSNDIDPYDTRDSLKRERFHPFTPGQHLTYKIPPKSPDWYAKYNPDLTLGYDCCSDHSISFHYVPHDLMRQMYNYVYLCTDKIIRDNQYP